MSDNSNSPLIQEMIEDHKFIRQSIKRINENLEANLLERDNFEMVINMIRILENRLKGHFTLEEEHGILNDLVEEKPRLNAEVELLLGEHKDMLGLLEKMHTGADDPDLNLELFVMNLKEYFSHFITMLLQHEAQENKLIHEAYQTDIGDKD